MRGVCTAVILLTAVGCGDDDSMMGADAASSGDASVLLDVMVATPGATPIAPHTECTVTTARVQPMTRDHLEPCSAVTYPMHPPAAGDHYGVWADWRTYDMPVPPGFLVHAMEHGGVVLLHDCEGGCPEVLSEFASIISDHGADPGCEGLGIAARFIVAPDPMLDVPIAVVAWERVYLATCLDPPSLRAFAEDNYGNGPEDLCARGLDDEARGWCD